MKISEKMRNQMVETLLKEQGKAKERIFTKSELIEIIQNLEQEYKTKYNEKYFRGVQYKYQEGGLPNAYKYRALGTYVYIKLEKGKKTIFRIGRSTANYVSKEWRKGTSLIYA